MKIKITKTIQEEIEFNKEVMLKLINQSIFTVMTKKQKSNFGYDIEFFSTKFPMISFTKWYDYDVRLEVCDDLAYAVLSNGNSFNLFSIKDRKFFVELT